MKKALFFSLIAAASLANAESITVSESDIKPACKKQFSALLHIRDLRKKMTDFPSIKYIAKTREEAFLACHENRPKSENETLEWDINSPDKVVIASSK